MFFANQSSSCHQPYESVGALSMVNTSQIRDEQNLDYLQKLCGFMDHMNLNPLWYQNQSPADRLKFLQLYQMAINYSSNLSQSYSKEIDELQSRKGKIKEQSDAKEKDIRNHKIKVERMKDKFRRRKHRYYQNVYKHLKHKLKEQERGHNRKQRHGSERSDSEPSVVYKYVQAPPPYYYPPHPHQPSMPSSNQHTVDPYPPSGHFSPHPYPAPPPYSEQPPPPPQPYPEPAPQGNTGIPIFGNSFGGKLQGFLQNFQEDPKNVNKNSRIQIDSPTQIHTKKIQNSVDIEQSKKSEDFQTSQIISKSIKKSSKADESSKRSNMKRQISLQPDEENFPDLMVESRKKSDVKKTVGEPSSKNSIESSQDLHYESIANLRLGTDSRGMIGDPQNLESRISKDPKNPNAQNTKHDNYLKVSKIEEEEDLDFSLAEKSGMKKKISKEKKTQFSQKDSNLEKSNDSIYNLGGDSKFTKNQKPQKKTSASPFDSKPRRASKQIKEATDQVRASKVEENKDDELFGMELGGDSKIQKKKNSTSKNTDPDDFGNIGQSAQITKKSRQGNNSPVKMYEDNKIVRKSHLPEAERNKKVRFSQESNLSRTNKSQNNEEKERPEEERRKQQERKKKEQQQKIKEEELKKEQDLQKMDFLKSNIGQKSNNSSKGEKMFDQKDKPQRSSNQNKVNNPNLLSVSRASASPSKHEVIEQKHEEEDDYADDFEFNDQDLLKTKVKENNLGSDQLDFDPVSLEQSYNPKSKKQSQIDKQSQINKQSKIEPQKKNELSVVESKKPEASSVNIVMPSSQSINEIPKYQKLKNGQFKCKQNITGTIKLDYYQAPEEEQIDFIPNIPAHSTIAKRPVLKSQMIKNERTNRKSTSIANISEGQQISGSQNKISINLINPDHQTTKLKSKNDYKQKDSIKQQVSDQVKALNNSRSEEPSANLLQVGGVLQSKSPSEFKQMKKQQMQKQSLELPVVKGVLESKPPKPNIEVKVQEIQKEQNLHQLPRQLQSRRTPKKEEKKKEQDKKRKSSLRKGSGSQIEFKLEDESKIAGQNEDYRRSILTMAKTFEVADRRDGDIDRFQIKKIDETLKKVCKVNLSSLKSIDEIEKYTLQMDRQIEKSNIENEKKKKKIAEFLKEQNIATETPPRLQSHTNLQDSLNYSTSSFKDPSILNFGSKKYTDEKQSKLGSDLTASIQINDSSLTSSAIEPLIPDKEKPIIRKNLTLEVENIQQNKSEQKRSPKAENKYIMDENKQEGMKEQSNLYKKLGEGIDKFDKDDELNSNVLNLVSQNNKIKEEDEDEWD